MASEQIIKKIAKKLQIKKELGWNCQIVDEKNLWMKTKLWTCDMC